MSHTDKNMEDVVQMLMKGYIAMSEINLEESDLCIESDNDALRICEEKLTECE